MRKYRKLLLALLLIAPVIVMADYVFKTLDVRNGLTSSHINCIHKDKRGFMWFGTPSGLYRYDGYNFKSFQCNSLDGSSLPDSYIKSIQETKDGSLWIETSAGYCVYSPKSESFDRDMKQIFTRMGIDKIPTIVYLDQHYNLWGYIPSTGVVCYKMQEQLLYEFGYNGDERGIPQGTICAIGECKDGAILVYDDGRIVCCDVMHQQRTVWVNDEIAQRKLRRTKSLRVFTDQQDNIWIYGLGTLFQYNTHTKVWNTSVGDQLGLTGIGTDHSVNSMGGDQKGNIWIGTNRHSLMRCTVNDLRLESVPLTSMNAFRPMAGNASVQCIYIDDTNLLWVGTEKSGVAFWGHHIHKFDTKMLGDVTAMAEDDDGNVWYGTSDNGIVDFSGQLISQKVSAMAFAGDGSLWVGSTQNGLTRIKDGTSQFYSLAKDSLKTLIDDHINALCTDKTGNLWIATDGGLQVYNHRMNTFSTYSRENGKMRTNTITTLFYGKDNRLIIGTSEGVVIMNLSTTEATYLTGNSTNLEKFTNTYITQVFEDSRGLIWIGTREGVNILNLENDKLDKLTERNGLCNNNISGIAEDKNHNIWLTTSNGITRVVVQRNHEDSSFGYGLYNYDVRDGLQSNEFNPGSIIKLKDGNVIFGGLYGVNWVRPKTADEKNELSEVILTQFFIGEEEVLTGHTYDGNIPLPQAINETDKIELKSSQNTITFKFAAGNYNQSERLQFQYWMDGLDDMWRNGDALTHGVTFTNLKSKTYHLHVKAVSAEGAVSKHERVITIVVDQPWLLSWWMLLVYAVLIIFAIYLWKKGIDNLNLMWSKKKAIILALQRQRDEIRDTGDDLRQPMARMASIISNLSERENSTPEEREQLNALHSQLLQIITRISDMQTTLEHPEEKAKTDVDNRFALNSKGELNLPETLTSDELTSEMRRHMADSPTMKFKVLFIDDNDEFIKFTNARLKYVYDFHPYNDIRKAADDIEMMMPDLIICKQDMSPLTGSDLCSMLKKNYSLHKIKFVLMIDSKLTPVEMKNMNITFGADDYLVKPFNIQEAVMRFNTLLGIGAVKIDNLIEGAETRMLEDRNSSMTTATESIDYGSYKSDREENNDEYDEMEIVDTQIKRGNSSMAQPQQTEKAEKTETTEKADTTEEADTTENTGTTEETGYQTEDQEQDDILEEYSMADTMDMQLLKNIEQYVLQNMSRGQIQLEEMASAMGMGRVPFFHKVRNITGKTPAELVRDMRLKHACLLLKRTNINMSELATNVGFMTGENFINIFKEKFGISPLEYRLKHRK